jgi:regulator of protease activity HflC (stomatin/prohibitin superfamily)
MNNPFPLVVFILIFLAGLGVAYSAYSPETYGESLSIGIAALLVATLAAAAVKIADQWKKAVVLRLGRFRAVAGPGLFFIIPIIDTIPYWIDTRVITATFKAEKTLTKDTVPVDVDAVLFWKVIDAQKAALDVADYQSAIGWASQTALRDVIGKTLLADMLEGRQKISDEIRKIIDERAGPWGNRRDLR